MRTWWFRQLCVTSVQDWVSSNGFTVCMHFCSSCEQYGVPYIILEKSPTKGKFLGVVFDRTSSYNNDVNDLKTNCLKVMDSLKVVRPYRLGDRSENSALPLSIPSKISTGLWLNCIFSHGKFGLPSPGKASWNRVALPNLRCMLGVYFPNPPNSDMDYGIFNVHTDVNACDCTRGCTDILRGYALKIDSTRIILCRTEESNLRRRLAGSMLYQLNYIPAPYGAASNSFQRNWIIFTTMVHDLAAFRTSPVTSLYAKAQEMSLNNRRKKLSMNYALKLKTSHHTPAYSCSFWPTKLKTFLKIQSDFTSWPSYSSTLWGF